MNCIAEEIIKCNTQKQQSQRSYMNAATSVSRPCRLFADLTPAMQPCCFFVFFKQLIQAQLAKLQLPVLG